MQMQTNEAHYATKKIKHINQLQTNEAHSAIANK
jgi:hypothetical protein